MRLKPKHNSESKRHAQKTPVNNSVVTQPGNQYFKRFFFFSKIVWTQKEILWMPAGDWMTENTAAPRFHFSCYSWNIRHNIDPHFPRYETWKCSSQIHFAQWFIPLTKYRSGSSPYLISLREGEREREGGGWGLSVWPQHVRLTTQFLRQECNLAVAIDRFPSPLPVDALRGENVEQNGRSRISFTQWGQDGLIAHGMGVVKRARERARERKKERNVLDELAKDGEMVQMNRTGRTPSCRWIRL